MREKFLDQLDIAYSYGLANSQFDWSAGAYEQVFTAHPEWRGRVIADLNFELPALAHGTRARTRRCSTMALRACW